MFFNSRLLIIISFIKNVHLIAYNLYVVDLLGVFVCDLYFGKQTMYVIMTPATVQISIVLNQNVSGVFCVM